MAKEQKTSESSLEVVRGWLEEMANKLPSSIDDLPTGFYDALLLQGLQVDLAEHGRLLCTLKVPPRLLNVGNFLHGGATAAYVDIIGSAAIFTTGAKSSGVSVEINVSYLNAAKLGEEIEIEAKVLRIGKAIAFVTVDLRKKNTGELIAQGRHTKYLAVTSKL
ncbi:hypothetical protein SUGI_0475840 [Cryptomeria japonica]|uniref:uncharacterized protein LOC131073312 n=1 Tax=Cryptomeria japonica TaxID=3369 RepID=UPI002408CDB1|nr:uncharacterized protein LOC131073312 [Cryptomeria japonica]GLJ24879.1 hypothetical protein SUGI_0475840 [Cryptomeria japonica]